jgi:hypothetical protein
MKYAPRCMRCATALADDRSFRGMVRQALSRPLFCPHCKINVPRSGAVAMGEAYGIHLLRLRKEVTRAALQLRCLELNDALRVLDPAISREQIQPAHTVDNVVRSVRETFRAVLLDQAYGRTTTLEVGVKCDDHKNMIAAGVWGMTSAESGDREQDLLFARVGTEQYIVYLPPKPSHWLHEIIRHQHDRAKPHAVPGALPARNPHAALVHARP